MILTQLKRHLYEKEFALANLLMEPAVMRKNERGLVQLGRPRESLLFPLRVSPRTPSWESQEDPLIGDGKGFFPEAIDAAYHRAHAQMQRHSLVDCGSLYDTEKDRGDDLFHQAEL